MPDIWLKQHQPKISQSWHIFHLKKPKNLLKQEAQYETLIWLMASRNKVVNEERRRVAVLGSKEFAVRRGVREGDLVFGQMTAKHEGAPENMEYRDGIQGYLFQISEVKCTEPLFPHISSTRKRYLTASSMRVAMLLRLARLNTQIRLMPQSAGSGMVAQHQALCLSMKLSFVMSFWTSGCSRTL